ncbi:hypothetical protein RND71_042049 [Anisodus tanguticus]|uniref:Uncharacterized protein n=1 Tax=Anisodus tanguticus TaxID=243964 RepID=A0AAE1QT00_9SOLA|nr:hypothetical protein RND71_042049 [Anisodus tanguticus]
MGTQDLEYPLIGKTRKLECKNSKGRFDENFGRSEEAANEIEFEVASFGNGIGKCIGHFMWAIIRCKAVSYGRYPYARAMVVLLLVSVPLACIWANAGRIPVLLGQDPEIAAEAGSYARYMIPTIHAYGFLQCHIRFLQTQNIVLPMMFSVGITTLLHIFTCWILVLKSGLGNKGAALANALFLFIQLFSWITQLDC